MDPVQLRIVNDTQSDPEQPGRPFSARASVECLRVGADRFGWDQRARTPASRQDGRWLVGTGMAGAGRGAPIAKAGAWMRMPTHRQHRPPDPGERLEAGQGAEIFHVGAFAQAMPLYSHQ